MPDHERYSRERKLDDEARVLEINKYHGGRVVRDAGVVEISRRLSNKLARTFIFFSAVPLGRLMREALVKIGRDSVAKWKLERELGL